jgi:hypothetical protein
LPLRIMRGGDYMKKEGIRQVISEGLAAARAHPEGRKGALTDLALGGGGVLFGLGAGMHNERLVVVWLGLSGIGSVASARSAREADTSKAALRRVQEAGSAQQ